MEFLWRWRPEVRRIGLLSINACQGAADDASGAVFTRRHRFVRADVSHERESSGNPVERCYWLRPLRAHPVSCAPECPRRALRLQISSDLTKAASRKEQVVAGTS